MIRKTDGFLLSVVALVGAALIVGACSSGSGGSQVGHAAQTAPTARVQALNGGKTNVFREGSEVLLTGKDSEDADGPLLSWSWRQTAGPTVELVQRDKTTYSFTAPHVTAQTKLSFALTVTDSDNLTDEASLDVTVMPAEDSNAFLTLDRRGAARNTFERFEVVPALAEGAATDSTPKPFTLSVKAYLVYPPHSNPNIDCPTSTSEFDAGVPITTSSGCLVEPLEDLTPGPLPGGGTGIQGEWPANVPTVVRPSGLTADQLKSEWWNPHYSLDVPRLDVADFNQPFVDSGERSRILDEFNAPKAHIVLLFVLTAPQNQQDATLIVNDVESAPITVPATPSSKQHVVAETKLVANDGAGLPTREVLPLEQVLAGIAGRESELTSEVYYRTVDPNNTRGTLNAWLQQAGFASDANGTLLPAARAGTAEFAHAIYLNNYDLGFGRNMYTRTDQYGNVYAFVGNYSTLEGAIRDGAPFATVVMEYSPLMNAADNTPKFVKFFTYVDDGGGDSRRVTSLNFDGRGEIFTPGNCIACHGGAKPPGVSELVYDSNCGDSLDAACYSWPAVNRDAADIAHGDLHATFLPWDVSALLFADTDPAITDAAVRFDGLSLQDRLIRDYGDYSRDKQEAQLKKLNEAAYATYCNAAQTPGCQTDAARRLVEHWYGGLDQNGQLVAARFDDSTAIEGWKNGETVSTPTQTDPGATAQNPNTAEGIYHDVYAHHCRMCHTNISDATLRFDNYQRFIAAKDLTTAAVFRHGEMPNARLTDDRFWVAFADGKPTAAEALANELGVQPVNGRLSPGATAEIAGLTGTMARNDTVRLSGANSAFADSYAWTVQYQPPSELANDQTIAAFQPLLVGAASSELAFDASEPGTYSIQLTVNGAEGAAVASKPVEVDVPNYAPTFGDLALSVKEGSSATLSVLDELNKLCATDNCPQIFGDPPAKIAVDVSGWNSADGDLTLDDATTGTVTLRATQPGPIMASVPFSVTDTDGEIRTASINVNVVPLGNPSVTDDAATVCAQTTIVNDPIATCSQHSVTTPGSRHVTIDVLSNDAADPSAAPLHLHSYTQPSGGGGTVTQSGDQLVFTPALGFVGTATFQYTAQDSNPTGSRVSNLATVNVTVTATTRFSVGVQAALQDTTYGCLSCHDSSERDITTCDEDPLLTAPNWAKRDNVAACVQSPARDSQMLVWPTNTNHGGGAFSTWAEGDPDFDALLRWIEEGARNN